MHLVYGRLQRTKTLIVLGTDGDGRSGIGRAKFLSRVHRHFEVRS
jgi:hypothetical protein